MSDLKTQGRGGRSRLPLMDRPAVLDSGQAPYWTSGVLGVVAGTGALLSVVFPGVLTGEPALDGNLRGTALVVLAVVLPLLALAMVRTAHGSARWLVVWIATVAHLIYQGFMFSFATPLNNFFLLYVAHLGLAVWAAAALLLHVQVAGFRARVDAQLPVRLIASSLLVIAALNGLAWIRQTLPASFTPDPQSLLEGSGLTTNPVYVQDLALWIPAMVLAAVWLWQRRAWGALLSGGLLAFASLESLTIAVDQWFGAQADSTSTWASADAVPVFAAAAVLVALPVARLLLDVDRARR